MRVNNSNEDDHFFKSDNKIHFVRINLTNEDRLFKQTILGWVSNTSDDHTSNIYDAQMINTEARNAIYSYKNAQQLTIRRIPSYWG